LDLVKQVSAKYPQEVPSGPFFLKDQLSVVSRSFVEKTQHGMFEKRMVEEGVVEMEYVRPKLDGKYGFVLAFEKAAVAVFYDEVCDYQGPAGVSVEKIGEVIHPL